MTQLLTLISAYSFHEVIFFIIVLFLLYLIYLKVTDDDYYIEKQDIKTKYQARMWEYLSGEMRIVESQSLNKVQTMMGLNTPKREIDKDTQQQFAMYSLVLERTVHHTLFEAIKTAIRINGFVDMGPDELSIYIADKSNVILRESRKSINGKMMYYPLLIGTDEERFTEKDAITVYSKIVMKYKKLHEQEKQEFIKLKKKYSIWTKINLLGALITKIKKSK